VLDLSVTCAQGVTVLALQSDSQPVGWLARWWRNWLIVELAIIDIIAAALELMKVAW